MSEKKQSDTPDNTKKATGAIILLGMAGVIIWLGGFEFLTIVTVWILAGLFSIYLYSFKANNWLTFILKILDNILFNPFYLILLLKSWTMLSYKDQLDELDKKQKEETQRLPKI